MLPQTNMVSGSFLLAAFYTKYSPSLSELTTKGILIIFFIKDATRAKGCCSENVYKYNQTGRLNKIWLKKMGNYSVICAITDLPDTIVDLPDTMIDLLDTIDHGSTDCTCFFVRVASFNNSL